MHIQKDIPMLKSSKTLVVDSTTSENYLKPYWNVSTKAINSALWLPTKTALQDSTQTLSASCSNRIVANSWFSTIIYRRVHKKNLSPMFSQSLLSSLQTSMGYSDTVTKSRKIRVFLRVEQRAIFRQWVGTARYVYNRTVEYLKQPDMTTNWYRVKKSILPDLPDWAKSVPYQIKSIAVRDACKAVKAAKLKCLKGDGFQKVSFRSRRQPIQSIYIPKSAINQKGVYHTKLGAIHYFESLPKAFGDSRLVRHNGRYYLTVSYKVQLHIGENQARVVALDPGIRCFQTFYSENSCGFLGKYDIGRIQRLCQHLDDLIARSAKVSAKQRHRMQKACNRMRHKIRDLVDELHHKVALFLVQNFDVILLPTFESSQMVKQGRRKLRSKSVRQMLSWAHYRFKVFLKHKAFEYGKVVLDVCEAYTSKTVSWTGEVIDRLGGAKTIIGNDGKTMDRDINGARGIFLRALADTPALQKACNVHC